MMVADEREWNKEDNKRTLPVVVELLIYVIVIFLFTQILPTFVIQRTIVDGSSMENTLYGGDNLLVEKISPRTHNLERFDIIAFYPYGKEEKEYYIKRIIGLPGEEIRINDNKIYINEELLEEDYGKTDVLYSGIASNGVKLKDDEYFVIGDNREDSLDSRYEEIGKIELNKIEGKAIFRVWPLSRFGRTEWFYLLEYFMAGDKGS